MDNKKQIVIDPLIDKIAEYVDGDAVPSSAAAIVAWIALFDALGCAMASTRVAECMSHVGPLIPGSTAEAGIFVPGTSYRVDPITAAFSIGCLVRWSDFSDTWVALETSHPSDNIGTILAAAAFECARRRQLNEAPYTLHDVMRIMVQAYEIQGVLGLTNDFAQLGLDHALLVRVSSAAVAAKILGGRYSQICSAISHAWCDGHPLRIYRQSPNVGPRKSWAGPDASARGMQLAFRAIAGEPPIGAVLTDPKWGMETVAFGGHSLTLSRALGSFVMENIVFKAAYPGVIHAQTALEAAIKLHAAVANKPEDIDRIDIWTYKRAIDITSKTSELKNPADRDHCLEYMVAVGLLKGTIVEEDFSDAAALDERIDSLRAKMLVHNDANFTARFLDPAIRACSSAMQITFLSGSTTDRIEIEQPLGHASRRKEGLPHLVTKLRHNLALRLPLSQVETVMRVFDEREQHGQMSVDGFLELFTILGGKH